MFFLCAVKHKKTPADRKTAIVFTSFYGSLTKLFLEVDWLNFVCHIPQFKRTYVFFLSFGINSQAFNQNLFIMIERRVQLMFFYNK